MAYIDITKLSEYIDTKELLRLTDDGNTGTIDQNKINLAIENAGSEMDSYLRDIYRVPLESPLPGELEGIVADITIYNLYKRRMQLDMPESITDIYKNAIARLEKIRKGIITINLIKSDTEGFIKINKTDNDRLFPKDGLM